MFEGFCQTSRQRLTKAAALLFLSSAALGAEPGHLLIYRDSNGIGSEVRKVRKLERAGGFYIAQLFPEGTEKFDAYHVTWTIDLASLQPVSIKSLEDIAAIKATETRARAAAKQYPQIAPQLTPYLTPLRAEIERAERGDRKMDGKWVTAAEVAAKTAQESSSVRRGTLLLKNGTSYQDVEVVSANKDELRIVHSSGAARIPMGLVPEEFKSKYLTPAQTGAAK